GRVGRGGPMARRWWAALIGAAVVACSGQGDRARQSRGEALSTTGDPYGQTEWARQLSARWADDLRVDSDGNPHLLVEAIDSTGYSVYSVEKRSSDGSQFIWSTEVVRGQCRATGLAVTSLGNSLVTTYCADTTAALSDYPYGTV